LKGTLSIVLASAVLALAVTGCDSGSDTSKLEKRVAKLEAENAALRREIYGPNKGLKLESLRSRLKFVEGEQIDLLTRILNLDKRTWANDQALWTGVGKAQYDINCGIGDDINPDSTCVYGSVFPGAVSASLESRRLRVSPWPTARRVLVTP
jgi:hypothetical protein